MRQMGWLVLTLYLLCCSNGGARAAPMAEAVDEALQNITTLMRPDKVGYATVWDGNKFIQCRRMPERTMRCEAAGSIMQPSLARVMTAERLNRLAALGWTLDPAFGNYTQVFAADKPTSQIADQIMRALVEVYDAKADDVETRTEWVEDVECPPRAGYSQSLAGSVIGSPSMRSVVLRECTFKPRERGDATLTDQSLDELRAIYGNRLKAEVQRLRLNRSRRVYSVFQAGIGYIQCMPDHLRSMLFCEAQSAESWAALSAILTPPRVAILRQAGHADPGRTPNYAKDYPMSAQTDGQIADEILTILHRVYGYTGKVALKTITER